MLHGEEANQFLVRKYTVCGRHFAGKMWASAGMVIVTDGIPGPKSNHHHHTKT